MLIPLLDLPLELILQIICELPPSSIKTCQLVNKYLNNLIHEAVVLQYALALDAARAEDNPLSTLPISSKLKALRSSEGAWALLRPDFTTSIPVTYHQSGVYDLSAGVYILSDVSRTLLYTLNLPSKKDDQISWNDVRADKFIVDIGLCLYEHDLIALVTTSPRQESVGSFDIEIELREFSTDKPHPLAEKPRLYVMNSPWEKPAIGIEIVGKHLVVILSFINADRPQDRIFVFDWQKNVLKASFEALHRSYAGLLFLSEDLILLPNTNTNALDVFRIPETTTLESPTPLCRLSLPPLQDGRVLGVMTCRSEPNPIAASSYPEMKRRAAARAEAGSEGSRSNSAGLRAFLAKSADTLCLFELRILVLQLVMLPGGGLNMHFQFRHRFSFVTHRNALLDVIKQFEEKKAERELFNEAKNLEEQQRLERGEVMETVPGNADETPNIDDILQVEFPHHHFFPPPPGNLVPPADPATTPSDPSVVPWRDWGPPITRWFNSDNFTTHWITTSAGQRLVRMAEASAVDEQDPFVVLDFNEERVKKMKRWLGKQPGTVEARIGGRRVALGILDMDGGVAAEGQQGQQVEEAGYVIGGEDNLDYDGHPVYSTGFAVVEDHDAEEEDRNDADTQEGILGINVNGAAFHEYAAAEHYGHVHDEEDDDDDGASWITAPETALSTTQLAPTPADAASVSTSQAPASASASASASTSASSSTSVRNDIHSDNGSDDWVDTDSSQDDDAAHNFIDFAVDGADEDEDHDMDQGDEDDDADNGMGPHARALSWDAPPPGSVWWAPAGDKFEPADVFAEPLISGLPYVACVSHGKYRYDGIMLDEDRVIGTCGASSGLRFIILDNRHAE